MRSKLTVACVNEGTKYDPKYVHILYNMVKRHLDMPFEFICLTDKPENYADAPFKAIKEQSGLPGWWAKLGLFNRANGLSGRVLYLDLDVVVVSSLDKFIKKHKRGFWIIRDWLDGMYNSSVMLFTAEKHYDIYDQFNWRDMGAIKTDQHFIYKKYGECKIFKSEDIQSYKQDACEEAFGKDAKVVVFHGYPKPPDCGGWVAEFWN